jgi:hypothetical protein
MSQEIHIMNKTSLPPPKGRPFTSENLPISKNPYMPTCHHEYLHEKRFCKLLPGMIQNLMYIIINHPFKLEIVPDPDTEVTLEKEVYSILMHMQRT